MQNVNMVIYIAIAVVAVIGALLGLKKGIYKALINLAVVAINAVASFAIARLITKWFVSEEKIIWGIEKLSTTFPQTAELFTTVKDTIIELSEQNNSVGMVMSLPTVILTPFIFLALYLVLGLLLKIPEAIICRSIFGKNGGNRLGGLAVGAVTKVLSLAICIVPIVGYITFANDVMLDISSVESTIEETEEGDAEPMSDEVASDDADSSSQASSIGNMISSISELCAQLRTDYVEPISDNIVVKSIYTCGGKWFFNSLTTTKVDDVKISLYSEVDVLIDVYKEAVVLFDAPIQDYGEAQTTAVTNITNSLDNAVVVPSVVSGALSYVSDAWLNGEDVLGYEKINVGEYYEPTFDKILTIFAETTKDTISQDIHTAGNVVNICIEQGFFKEMFGGGSPMTVIQKEAFMGGIFVELYKNDTTRPFVADLVNSFKNYIYRIYNEVNGTSVPYPTQLDMNLVTEEMMYNEGALIASIFKDFMSFYNSFDQTETDNTKIIIDTDLRALGRAFDNLKRSMFIGDSYGFILEALLRSEGASQIAFLTPEFIEVMLVTDSSMEIVLVARQQIAIIASVSNAEDREYAIEHLLQNIDTETAKVIMQTLSPEVLKNLGMSRDESNAMSSTLGSLVQEIANQDGEFTEEELKTEVDAVDKIVSTVQAAANGDVSTSLFSTEEGDTSSKTGMTADELVETVVSSKVVSSAINSSSTDEEGNVIEDPYGISNKMTAEDKDSARSAIENYYNDNAIADGDNSELKQTLDSLASIFGVQVNLGE